ncbi:RBBP9/YdeN family alpha/beta hydrolase [Brevibacillus dissolubilis]|uniref:RBBP9/YdeN family alpha/beta hydrolase n=1 Tax=Brevibacillus dissolubilis TaxID=1844116 RepID=UPI00159BED36|nr:alpha/beta hydrolase [Brevibacillus dissolubilis]
MEKQSLLLLHGLGGSGPQHWQSWLAVELRQKGLDVHYPTFTDFDTPQKDVWLQELAAAMEQIPADHQVTVVTHSCGCLLWLHHAATGPARIVQRAILVAPPAPSLVIPEAASFSPVPLVEADLKQASHETLFVMSSDDPYCSLEEATHYMQLGAPAVVFPNMGHINTASGHGEWSWILEQCLRKGVM